MKYVNLGLPSGTRWADENEKGFYEFDEAIEKFGNSLPTRVQLVELKALCRWEWTGSGYEVTGPNGNSMRFGRRVESLLLFQWHKCELQRSLQLLFCPSRSSLAIVKKAYLTIKNV